MSDYSRRTPIATTVPPGPRALLFDRLGLWTLAAIVLVIVAYGPPIWNHLQMTRFGSPAFSPF
jgi:hypothetical protein